MSGDKFLLSDMIKSVAKDGKPYFRCIMTDVNGNRNPGIMFDTKSKLSFDPDNGQIVQADYAVQEFNGQKQYRVTGMVLLDGADAVEFMPKSRFCPEEMMKELTDVLVENLSTSCYMELVNLFMSDTDIIERFKKSPAAKSVHHAFVGGLLEHTLSVVKLAAMTGEYYKETLDKEVILLGALFHDIGKVFELDLNAGFEYSNSGKLLGHLVQGTILVRGYLDKISDFPEEKKDVIIHMILSHHGLIEYGAVQLPKTAEAIILHHLDDMDAKINTVNSIFDKENVEQGWSSYDRLLERQLFKHN